MEEREGGEKRGRSEKKEKERGDQREGREKGNGS
jgi:hypothetical protein